MELRKAAGMNISRLGLGTMTWGRDTDEHEAADQARAFLDSGGNLIDTAAVYGAGDSEKVVGGLIGSLFKRENVLIATKAGIVFQDGVRTVNTSRGALLSELDASLKRLGTDYVDLWQVHTWDENTPLDDTLSALDTAYQTGRARYVGISNYSGWQSARAITKQELMSIQSDVNSKFYRDLKLTFFEKEKYLPKTQIFSLLKVRKNKNGIYYDLNEDITKKSLKGLTFPFDSKSTYSEDALNLVNKAISQNSNTRIIKAFNYNPFGDEPMEYMSSRKRRY